MAEWLRRSGSTVGGHGGNTFMPYVNGLWVCGYAFAGKYFSALGLRKGR